MSRLEDQLPSLLADAPPALPAFDFEQVVTRVRRRRARLAVTGVAATAVVVVSVVLPLALTRSSGPVRRPTLVAPSAPAVPTPSILADVGGTLGIYSSTTGKLQHTVPISGVEATATDPAGGWVVVATDGGQQGPCPVAKSSVHVVDASGGVHALDGAISGEPTSIAMSPDATKVAIAFDSPCAAGLTGIEITSLGAAPQVSQSVLPTIDGNEIDGLSWSPDGQKLVFTAGNQTGGGIFGAPTEIGVSSSGKIVPGTLPETLADGCSVVRTAWLTSDDRQVVLAECPSTRDDELVDVVAGTLNVVSPAVRIPAYGAADAQLSVAAGGTVLVTRGDISWAVDGTKARKVLAPTAGVTRASWEGFATPGTASPTALPTSDAALFSTNRTLDFGASSANAIVGLDASSVFVAGVFNRPKNLQDSLIRIDRNTMKIAAEADPPSLASFTYGDDAVWAAVGQQNPEIGCNCPPPAPSVDLLKLDPTTLKTTATFALSAPPLYVAVAEQALWVATDDALLRIDPTTGRQLARIPTGFQPLDLTASPDGALLYFLGTDITYKGSKATGTTRLLDYDATTGQLLGTHDDPRFDQPLAATSVGVWADANVASANDADEEFTGPALSVGPAIRSDSRDLKPYTFGGSVLLVDEQAADAPTICIDPATGHVLATGAGLGISLGPAAADAAGAYVLEDFGNAAKNEPPSSKLLDVTPSKACAAEQVRSGAAS